MKLKVILVIILLTIPALILMPFLPLFEKYKYRKEYSWTDKELGK